MSKIPASGGAIGQLIKNLHPNRSVQPEEIPDSGGAVAGLIEKLHVNPAGLARAFTQDPNQPNAPIRKQSQSIQSRVPNQHIFISYCHSDKEIVYKINKSLKARGYQVWIDSESMRGNLLEGMAQAVEKSWLVLLCISKKYQESKNCKTEAEYTFQQEKHYVIVNLQHRFKPNGWLGALLGTRLYYDFSGSHLFDEMMQKLTKEIEDVKMRSLKRRCKCTS